MFGLQPVERMIAKRYLKPQSADRFIRIISGFSRAGIALGVMTLIVVTSVMNGVRSEMIQQFIGFGGHVAVYGERAPLGGYAQLAAEIKAIKGVKSALPTVEGQVMVSANGQAAGAQVSAFRDADLPSKQHVLQKVVAGDVLALTKPTAVVDDWAGEAPVAPPVVLGEALARQLHVAVDDNVTLISPNGRATVVGTMPRIKDYRVVAIVKFGMHSLDSALVLLSFAEAQRFFQLNRTGQDRASSIEVAIDDADAAPAIAEKIEEIAPDELRVYPWQQLYQSVFQALLVQRNVMFIILTMIVLVAAFNIIASLMMLVQSKRMDVAILRTMGATQATVQRVFVLTGVRLGMVGTAWGVGLGLLLAWNLDRLRLALEHWFGIRLLGEELYFISSLPAKVNPMEVLSIIGMALVLSFAATLYPARKAARIAPAEALRYGN